MRSAPGLNGDFFTRLVNRRRRPGLVGQRRRSQEDESEQESDADHCATLAAGGRDREPPARIPGAESAVPLRTPNMRSCL
jgi:hypothetical protein